MSKLPFVSFGLLFLLIFTSCSKELVTKQVSLKESRFLLNEYDSILVSQNVVYGNNSDVHWMNVYQPFDDQETIRPLVILAPGGGFMPELIGHSFDLLQSYAERLAQAGFVAAVINYTTGRRETGDEYRSVFIQASYDLKAAIRYFRQDADDHDIYRIHPDWIFNLGWSAGAKIGMFNAYVRSEEELTSLESSTMKSRAGFEGNSGNPGYSTDVRGIVAMSGNMIDISRISAGDPPILCIHSDIDDVVNIETQNSHFGTAYGSRPIIQKAKEVGISAKLIELKNASHIAPLKDYCTPCFDYVLEFLASQLAE